MPTFSIASDVSQQQDSMGFVSSYTNTLKLSQMQFKLSQNLSFMKTIVIYQQIALDVQNDANSGISVSCLKKLYRHY